MNQPFGNYQDHLRLDTLKDNPDVPQPRMLHCLPSQETKQSDLFLIFLCVYLSVFLNVCLCTTCMPGDQGKQKGALDPLALELQGAET